MQIQLKRLVWSFDETACLGKPGGFGEVFRGHSPIHGNLAIKRIKLQVSDAAHREMRMADEFVGRKFEHVIPVFDCGWDEKSGHYYIVMPLADRNLDEFILGSGRLDDMETRQQADAFATTKSEDPRVAIDPQVACSILKEIALGLQEVPNVVHRDLKPLNVLFHEGAWKLADFGIAKFTSETTSLHTLKEHFTSAFAAPEQWREESVSVATDVYALGCIGYALLTGRPPFPQRSRVELKKAHLNSAPPDLPTITPKLRSLLQTMLMKSPGARPDVRRVINTLTEITEPSRATQSQGLASLAQLSAEITANKSQIESKKATAESLAEKRSRMAAEAEMLLQSQICRELVNRIKSEAPECEHAPRSLEISLGRGKLKVQLRGSPVPADAFSQSGWDVIGAAQITVRQTEPTYEWSASLWFARLVKSTEYRWYEVSYFASPLLGSSPRFQPYHLLNHPRKADEAAAPGMTVENIAQGPLPIDGEDMEEFFDRWILRFADACKGRLSHPRSLPIK